MSHLLKRTKKTCLKFFRKLSSSKQMHLKKLEEEEISTNNIVAPANYDGESPPSAESQRRDMDARLSPKMSSVESLTLPDAHHCTSYDNYAVQDFEPQIETATELKDYGLNESKTQNNTVLQSLTSKLFLTADGYEFRRLQQLRSDTVSEVVQFEPAFEYHECGEEDDLVFEKVNYRQHVRYFRHTPSSSSLDNFPPGNTFTTTECGALKTYHSNRVCNNFSNTGLQQQSNVATPNPYLPVNVSLGSKLNGNYQNVVISEERNFYNKLTPVVKWDINGNSLDEDDIFINDNWDDFDTKLGNQDKRFTQLTRADDSQKSSHRSSSTTLETWLDDELLENSYQERHNCNFCLMKA